MDVYSPSYASVLPIPNPNHKQAGLVDEITIEKAEEVAAVQDIDLDALVTEDEGINSPELAVDVTESGSADEPEAANGAGVDGPSPAAQKQGKLQHRLRTAGERPTAAPLKTGVLLKRGALNKNW